MISPAFTCEFLRLHKTNVMPLQPSSRAKQVNIFCGLGALWPFCIAIKESIFSKRANTRSEVASSSSCCSISVSFSNKLQTIEPNFCMKPKTPPLYSTRLPLLRICDSNWAASSTTSSPFDPTFDTKIINCNSAQYMLSLSFCLIIVVSLPCKDLKQILNADMISWTQWNSNHHDTDGAWIGFFHHATASVMIGVS